MDKLKESCLNMTKMVIDICEKHNLRYYMLGGTFLGAVRHKGFIPWDDDVDLGMPRPDYEKFLELVKTELDPRYKVTNFTFGGSNQYFTQVLDLKTKIKMTANLNSYDYNIWIDIFPLDGMPNNPLLRKIHKYKLLYRKMLIQFSDFENRINLKVINRPLHERILIKIAIKTKIGRFLDTQKCLLKIDKTLKKYNYDDCDYVVNFFGAYKFKEMFPKSYYGKGRLYKFEDIEMVGAEEYDKILTQMYGDYMKLPPENERGVHHSFEIIEL